MAVNPLFVFVGLSVTTVGGIVAVVQHNKAPSKPVPAVVLPAPANPSQPATKKVATPAPPSPVIQVPKAKPTVQKLASLEPKQDVTKTSPPTPEIAKKIVKPEATVTAIPLAPTFDMVRVEKDGGAVVAGKAEPGAKMVLKLNGKVIGKTTANEKGDWVFVPDQLVPQGSNELIVEAVGESKKLVRSKQSIFIAIAKGAKEKPLIVVAKPDAPTRVLQQPEASLVPVKVVTPKPVKTPVAKIAKQQTKSTPTPVAVKLDAAPKAVPTPKKLTKKIAGLPKPVEMPKSEIKVEQQKLETKKAKITPVANPIKQPRLTFGTVDYNDSGEIVFTGKAAAGATVRLYVDNIFVGDAVAEKSGHWVFHGKEQIKPGVHALRADQVDGIGKVAQRTGVPFVRANPKKVAALLKTRKEPAPKIIPPKTPAVVAEKAPTKPIAKTTIEPPVIRKVAKIKAKPQPTEPKVVATPKKQAMAPVPETARETLPVSTSVAPPVATPKVTPTQPKLVSHVVIQPGNNLWNISRVIYGKGIAYTTIYQANQDQIKNPDQIYPGQIFTTPGTTSTGSIKPDQREPLNQPNSDKTAQN